MDQRILFFTALCVGAALISNAAAAEETQKTFAADVVMELQTEQTLGSDDSSNEHNNTFWRTEVAPTVRLNDSFFIDGVAVLEPVRDFDVDENNFFEEEGAFVEELKLNYENGPWAAFAGKFNPGFGIAWDYGRGIWGEDFAEDYEITEKIGVGASYTFEGGGEHTLTGSTFFADTSFLSDSVGNRRGDTDKSDGGVSNTEDFSSFVVALEGDDVFEVEDLYYKLGYRHLAEGDADVDGNDENGFEATAGYTFPISGRVKADALVEYVDISHFEGSENDNRYFTASVVTKIDDAWNVTLGYTGRTVDVDGGDDVDDHLFQASGGYDFGNGLTLEAGWRNTQEGGDDTNMIGGLARYSFSF